jgi:putative transposase
MSERYKPQEGINYYLITCSTAFWTPVFVSGETCRVITSSLDYCRRKKGLKVFAYVIMPTHFHAVVACDNPKKLSDVMRDLKRHTSRELIRVLETGAWQLPLEIFKHAKSTGKGNTEYKVWQDAFHPKGIFSENGLRQKIDYIHQNPVRKGLVDEATDWKYSSARNYTDNSKEIILEIDELEV